MATTWDPNNKSATETLSGGNLTATSSGVGTVGATRVLTSPLSYFEAKPSTLTGTVAVGLVNRGYNMASGTILGTDANGVGFKSSGAVVINNATVSTIFTYANIDTIGVAIDLSNKLIWFTKNGTTWNNDVIGNQNPVGAVGGISLATMTLGSAIPAVSGSLTGAVWVGVFSGFAYTAPTGFNSVDTCGATATNSDTSKTATYSTTGPTTNHAVTITVNARASVNPGSYGSSQKISGTITESGSPVAKSVMVFQTGTGELIGAATSSAVDGSFAINTQGVSGTMFAVAFDPTTYRALVYDAVQPV
jgi:hypothetical protein